MFGSQNARPVSLFLITPPSKKIKTSSAATVILRRCKQTGWHTYNIYIYKPSFYLVLTTTSHPSRQKKKSKEEEEVYIIYKTGEENNIFKCWKKLGKLSSSIYVSCAAMERSNILIFIWLPRHLYAVVKYNKGRVSLCSHQAVKISW